MPDEYLIEKRPDKGDFAVRKPDSDRVSKVEPTQKDAIDAAKKMNPDATIHVERVRHTKDGGPDKWRKL